MILKKHNLKLLKNVFDKKNIPFRSFIIDKRKDEKTLGELFTFFILETLLLGRALNINPYDQPAVELIKKKQKKILISNNYFRDSISSLINYS